MTKRKIISISLQQDDVELLERVAEEVGLTKSELIRRMLKKISFDPKMKDIIKRGYLITSHNVHYEKQGENADEQAKKINPGDQSGEETSSMAPTKIIPGTNYTMKEAIALAKTRWIPEEQQ